MNNNTENNIVKNTRKKAAKKLSQMINISEYNTSISNSNDMVNVFTMFIIVGFLIQYLFNTPSSDGYSGQATAEIWSYGIMLLSLVCILIFNTIVPVDPNKTPGIATLLPIILILIAFFWAISIRLKYYKPINKKEVPKSYYSWSLISNILLTIEALMIVMIVKIGFNNALNPSKINNQINNVINLSGGQESMKIALGNFIIVFIIFVVLGIQQVILDNFMVDG
tara:strand:+ start:2600 stop:3271 length:672 start_codon:yes stop_codon:yes gene_type:complete